MSSTHRRTAHSPAVGFLRSHVLWISLTGLGLLTVFWMSVTVWKTDTTTGTETASASLPVEAAYNPLAEAGAKSLPVPRDQTSLFERPRMPAVDAPVPVIVPVKPQPEVVAELETEVAAEPVTLPVKPELKIVVAPETPEVLPVDDFTPVLQAPALIAQPELQEPLVVNVHRMNLKIAQRAKKRSKDILLLTLNNTPEVDVHRTNYDLLKETFPVLQAGVETAQQNRDDSTTEEFHKQFDLAYTQLIANQKELAGLPFRMGKDCWQHEKLAQAATAISTKMNRTLPNIDAQRQRAELAHSRVQMAHQKVLERVKDPQQQQELFDRLTRRYVEWKDPLGELIEETFDAHGSLAASTMDQIFQVRDAEWKLRLIESCADHPGRESTRALARMTIYDFDPEVRQQARAALKRALPSDYRDMMLEAMRSPWAPAADHAAIALVELGDYNSTEDLREMLTLPDPAHPFQNEDGTWQVREMVKLNHLRNCMACHAASTASTDSVRGAIPSLGNPIPRFYYSQPSNVPFVRADVVYLRQNFSLMHAVAKPDKWPQIQRFDYLVRTRDLKLGEIPAAPVNPSQNYPQREAVLYALKELTKTTPEAILESVAKQ